MEMMRLLGRRNFLGEVLETEWQKQSGINDLCLLSSPVEGLAQLGRAILAVADGCSSLCCSNIMLQFFMLNAGMFSVLLWRLELTAEYLCF